MHPCGTIFYLAATLCLFAGCDEDPLAEDDPLTRGAMSASQTASRPNILWLVAEDMSPTIPPFGDSTIATPNLSRLAAEGIRYTHVFSPSGVCSPSRAAIATGMYPTAIGAMHMRTGPWYAGAASAETIASAAQYMPDGVVPYEAMPPAGVRMHSEYLRELGYYTSNNAKQDYQFVAPATAWDANGRDAHWRDREPGQPFFSIFNFEVTHESRIWGKSDDPLLVPDSVDVPIPPYLPDVAQVRTDVRRMYSNIVEMDAQVGEILDQLEAEGLLDNTIIFWYTDHGGPLPRQKRALYDSGLRVPMIISFPDGRGAGTVDDRLISFIDFLPTLLSLAGEPAPDYVHGRAFLGAHEAPLREYIHAAADRFDEAYDTIRAVRDARYKYLRNFDPDQPYYLPLSYREQMATMQAMLQMRDAGTLDPDELLWFRETKPEEELFDTQSDPHELNNLADDQQFADVLERLRAEYERWQATVPDYGQISESDYIDMIWPEGDQPRTAMPTADSSGQQILLASATDGASIGYQVLDSSTAPGPTWRIHEGPVAVGSDERLIAVAHRIGYLPSDSLVVGR